MNTISYIGGLIFFMVGYVTGARAWATFRRREPLPPAVHGDVCQCEHTSSTHDLEGCHAQVQRESRWNRDQGYPTGYEWVGCACVRFVGPASSYVPELDAAPRKEDRS